MNREKRQRPQNSESDNFGIAYHVREGEKQRAAKKRKKTANNEENMSTVGTASNENQSTLTSLVPQIDLTVMNVELVEAAIKANNKDELENLLGEYQIDIMEFLKFENDKRQNFLDVAFNCRVFGVIEFIFAKIDSSLKDSTRGLRFEHIAPTMIHIFKKIVSSASERDSGWLNNLISLLKFFKRELQAEENSGSFHPVIDAVRSKKAIFVEELLKEGFNPKEAMDGKTALQIAFSRFYPQSLSIIKVLVEYGAKLDSCFFERIRDSRLENKIKIVNYLLESDESYWNPGEKQKFVEKNNTNPIRNKKKTMDKFEFHTARFSTKEKNSKYRNNADTSSSTFVVSDASPSTVSNQKQARDVLSCFESEILELEKARVNSNRGVTSPNSVAFFKELVPPPMEKLTCHELIIRIMRSQTEIIDLSRCDVSDISMNQWHDIKLLLQNNQYRASALYFGSNEVNRLIQDQLQEHIARDRAVGHVSYLPLITRGV